MRMLLRNTHISFSFARKLHSRHMHSSAYEKLASIVGKLNILSHTGDDLTKYTTDWTKLYHGGNIVIKPSSTNEIVDILKVCSKERLSIVPQGGNTGLVGGQVGLKENEIILSLERMNHVISIDPISAVAVVEAGCILEELNNHVEKYGFKMPVDLGAKGSCQIGGNVATNAGGLRLLRYGSLHQNVLGLEVVQANGEVLNMLKTLHKDNVGYHLKNIFIGSEGTLGVITKVAIQLKPIPKSIQVCLVKLQSFHQLPFFLTQLRSQLNEIISAIEFIDTASLYSIQQESPTTLSKLSSGSSSFTLQSSPLSSSSPFSFASATSKDGIIGEVWVLIECSGSDVENNKLRLETFLSHTLETEVALDAIIAQDQTQFSNLWNLREHVPVALMHLSRQHVTIHDKASSFTTITTANSNTGSCVSNTASTSSPSSSASQSSSSIITGRLFKYDVSLAVKSMSEFVYEIKQHLHSFNFPIITSNSYKDGVTSSMPSSHAGVASGTPVTSTVSTSQPIKTPSSSTTTASAINFTPHQRELIDSLHSYAHIQVCCFGHVGDQNLHLNVLLTWSPSLSTSPLFQSNTSDTTTNRIEEYKKLLNTVLDEAVYNNVIKRNGSVSAEHGIGQQKVSLMRQARSENELKMMSGIKKLMDPHNILNPGKLIPPELLIV